MIPDLPWFQRLFGQDYLRIWGPRLTAKSAEETAFGYFVQEDEDLQVLREVTRVLKPGGRFLIDISHREAFLRRFTPHEITRMDDGLIVLNERSFDPLTSRVSVQMTFISKLYCF